MITITLTLLDWILLAVLFFCFGTAVAVTVLGWLARRRAAPSAQPEPANATDKSKQQVIDFLCPSCHRHHTLDFERVESYLRTGELVTHEAICPFSGATLYLCAPSIGHRIMAFQH